MAKRKLSTRESDIMRRESSVKRQAQNNHSDVAPQVDTKMRTRSSKTQVCGKKVCDIPELLAHVLFFLPVRDLLAYQRVNKTWRDCIQDTPALRKKMFLQPEGIAESLNVDGNEHDGHKILLNLFVQMSIKEWYHGFVAHAQVREKGKFQPVDLIIQDPRHNFRPYDARSAIIVAYIFTDYLWNLPSSARSPEASWRKMLLSQPAISKTDESRERREDPGATLRLGEMVDLQVCGRIALRYTRAKGDMEKIIKSCRGHKDWENGLCGCLWCTKHGVK